MKEYVEKSHVPDDLRSMGGKYGMFHCHHNKQRFCARVRTASCGLTQEGENCFFFNMFFVSFFQICRTSLLNIVCSINCYYTSTAHNL